MSADCVALSEQRIAELPAPRPRKTLPHRNTIMLVLEHRGELLLEKRPATGVWGGLWCFPELASEDDPAHVSLQRYGAKVGRIERLGDVAHGFTHFSLTISPQRAQVSDLVPRAAEAGYRWLAIDDVKAAAIPAPVKRIVEGLYPAEGIL